MKYKIATKLFQAARHPVYRKISVFALLVLMMLIDPMVDTLLDPGAPFFTTEHLLVGCFTGLVGLVFIEIAASLVRRLTTAEREKEALKHHFDYLSKYANDIVVLLDENWKIIEVNDRALAVYGYTREELMAMDPLLLRVPEERIKFETERTELDFEKGVIFESRHQRKDGSVFPIEVNARIYRSGGKQYFWSIVRDITERKTAEDAIRRQRDRLRSLAVRMDNIREEERKNLARDMHDSLAQELTAIKMNIAVIAARSKHDPEMAGKIQYIRDLVDASIQSVRRITTSLRPGVLNELGIAAAIEWQVREFEKQYGISSTYKVGRDPVTVKEGVSIALFRILQESLTNVARHSGASHVAVKFEVIGQEVELSIYDNGSGIRDDSEENTESFGILGMKERAHEFGGTVAVERLPVKGTRITTRIPGELV